jgi:predicted transcriptional regulator
MSLNQETKEIIKNFILNYAEIHGLPDPGKSKSKKHSIIFLPTEMTYKSVHRDFIASLEENNNLKSLKYEAFRRL